MSNSKLVDYTCLTNHCTKPRQRKIQGISIHTMAGNGSVEGCGQVFRTREASSHYGIGSDGRVGQYVLEENRAWCCSHNVDHDVVTIEVASIQNYKEPYECTPEAFESLIKLCADICRRNGIRSLRWVEGRTVCPAFTGNWEVCNMVPHRYTSDKGKSCPGNYLFSKYGEIAYRVNELLKADKKEAGEVTQEQFNAMMDKWLQEQASQPEPVWSQVDGYWVKAKESGVMDGTRPEAPVKRVELAAVLGRLKLL